MLLAFNYLDFVITQVHFVFYAKAWVLKMNRVNTLPADLPFVWENRKGTCRDDACYVGTFPSCVIASCNTEQHLDRVQLTLNLHMPGIFSCSLFEMLPVVAPLQPILSLVSFRLGKLDSKKLQSNLALLL